MSKLDELIKELCPNGVEKIEIKRCVLAVNNIKWKYTSPEDIFEYIDLSSVDIETHRIINTIQINADNAPSRAQQVVQKNDLLLGLTRPMLKRYCIVSKDYDGQICSTGFSILRANEHIILSNYFYHLISSSEFFDYVEKNQKGASYPAITDKLVKEYKIPVPPLEVQREIVRILDSFTLLTAEITAELTAELTARKNQYEYYRDELLLRDKSTGVRTIDSLCKVSAGGDAPRDFMSKVKTDEYTIPIISNGIGENALYGYTNEAKIDKPSVTVAARGTVGYTEYRDYPYVPIIRLLSLIPNNTEELDTKFLYYCLQGKEYTVPATGIPQLTVPMIKQVEIPLPNIDIQRRIVSVLDNFEKICNDLNIGLPAEIEARKKQYEYYRDVLLTFAETGSTILTDRD